MKGSPKINLELEGLRGIAALTVAISHVIGEDLLKIGYNTGLSYLHFAHIAVLLFFILSGYVMGVNYPSTFDKSKYLKKRFIRIYPIYLIVLAFCYLIEPNLNWSKIWQSLFLLQGPFPGILTNVVLWSIHYEILFYLIFPFLPKTRKSLLMILGGSILISGLAWVIPSVPPIIGTYASGFAFWIVGLFLSKKSNQSEIKLSFIPSILILFCYNHLQPGGMILNFLGLANESRGLLSFADLFCLPVCLILISKLTNRRISRFDEIVKNIIILFPIIFIAYFLVTNRIWESYRWQYVSWSYLLFLITNSFSGNFISYKTFYRWGSISYALYIVHYPVAFALGKINKGESLWALPIWLMVSILLAYLLEHKLQPLIKELAKLEIKQRVGLK